MQYKEIEHPGKLIFDASKKLEERIKSQKDNANSIKYKCHTPLAKELAYEKKRELYIKKQINKQKEIQRKKDKRNESLQMLKTQHLNKSLTILNKNRSLRLEDEARKSSKELKRIVHEQKVQDNVNHSRMMNALKWETWNSKYNCVSAKSINESQLHSVAMESLKRIQNAFEKAQMDHERALLIKSQRNFVAADQRILMIRYCENIADSTK